MNPTKHAERRCATRTPHHAECRLLDPRTGRFLAAESRDRSAGGARLIVRNTRRFEPGQPVALLMPAAENQGVLTAAHATQAIIRRAITLGDNQQEIALEYNNAAKLAAS